MWIALSTEKGFLKLSKHVQLLVKVISKLGMFELKSLSGRKRQYPPLVQPAPQVFQFISASSYNYRRIRCANTRNYVGTY